MPADAQLAVAIRTDDQRRHATLALTLVAVSAAIVEDPLEADVVLFDADLPGVAQELRVVAWPGGGVQAPRCVVVSDGPPPGALLIELLSLGLAGTLRWDAAPEDVAEVLGEVMVRDPRQAAREAPAGDAATEVRALLEARRFEIVVQPIVDLQGGHLLAVEALARFGGPTPRPPQAWLELATRAGLRVELELALASAAVDILPALGAHTLLAINVGAETLLDPRTLELLRTVDARRVVLELTDHHDVDDYEMLAEAAAALRDLGVRVAIDDSGTGLHSVARAAQLRPAFLKIDRALVRGIAGDAASLALARALAAFAQEIGAEAIAEGIESAAEAHALHGAGVRYAQGFLIAPPCPPTALPLGPFAVAAEHDGSDVPEVIHAFSLPRRAEGDLQGAIIAVLRFLEAELPGDSAVVTQLDFARRRASTLATSGPAAAVLRPGTTFPLTELPEYWMARGEGPRLCPDVERDPVYGALAVARHPDFGAFMSVPLTLPDGTRFGAISCAAQRRNAFDRRDLAMLHGLAELLNAAAAEEVRDLHPVEVAAHLRHLAQRDPVTHALNAAGFAEASGEALRRPRPEGTTRYLVRFDLRAFDAVVERFGRAVADLVLRDLVSALRAAAQPMDLVGRVGAHGLAIVLLGRQDLRDVDTLLAATSTAFCEMAARREADAGVEFGVVELGAEHDLVSALAASEAAMTPLAGGWRVR